MDKQLEDYTAVAANYWDQHAYPEGIRRWWQCPQIWFHINHKVAGIQSGSPFAGFHKKLSEFKESPHKRAVSVGCGVGMKEISLLKSGVVEHFTLYEISAKRLEVAKENAIREGVASRCELRLANAFDDQNTGKCDLVYWNNSLHHMFDVGEALRWSYECLESGGILAADDFIGSDRFQWSDLSLKYASYLRSILPERLLMHPGDASRRINRKVERTSIEEMIKADPSEAPDSSRIIPELRQCFSNPSVILTGGVIYHTALNDILHNMKFPKDVLTLQFCLAMDDLLSEAGENQYAVMFAVK